jgi:hypothetical protein
MDIVYEYNGDIILVSRLQSAAGVVNLPNVIVNPVSPPADLSIYKIVNRTFTLLTAQELTNHDGQTKSERKQMFRAMINQYLRQTDWILDPNNGAGGPRKTAVTQFRIDLRAFDVTISNTTDPFTLTFPTIPAKLDEI